MTAITVFRDHFQCHYICNTLAFSCHGETDLYCTGFIPQINYKKVSFCQFSKYKEQVQNMHFVGNLIKDI